MAWDKTFQHALPGSSLAHKWGSFPFSRAPQHVDPNEALEKIWKLLHKKDTLKQLWYLLEKGATVHAIAKAVVYKLALEGVIQFNLGVVIYPTVGKMIATIGQAKGIKVKLNPQFADKTKDQMTSDTLNELMGKKAGKSVPKSAMSAMKLPKPDEVTQQAQQLQKLKALPQPTSQGLMGMTQQAGE